MRNIFAKRFKGNLLTDLLTTDFLTGGYFSVVIRRVKVTVISVISCLVFELITLNEEAVRTTKASLMYRHDVIGLSFFHILIVTIIMNYHALFMHQSVLRVNTGGRKY